MREDSFYCVQAYMVNDLHLKGIELQIYAIINGFSLDGESEFKGSLRYLMEWTSTSSKHTIIDALKSLIDKGYIQKNESITNGVKFCSYKTAPVVQKLHWGGAKNALGGGAKIAPNNIDSFKNIDDNKDFKEYKESQNVNNNYNNNNKDVSYHDSYHDSLANTKSEVSSPAYQRIVDCWNNHFSIKTSLSNKEVVKALNIALKNYNEETIELAIERYATILNDKNYYFNYQWSLAEFLVRKKSIPEFLDNGEKWVNYLNRENKVKPTSQTKNDALMQHIIDSGNELREKFNIKDDDEGPSLEDEMKLLF